MKPLEFLNVILDRVADVFLGEDKPSKDVTASVEPQRFVTNLLTVATPLTYGEFNSRKSVTDIYDDSEPGFLLEDTNTPHCVSPSSFSTWVPQKKFHEFYGALSLVNGFNFGTAAIMMHSGYRVTRKSWDENSYLYVLISEENEKHFTFHDGKLLENKVWEMTTGDVFADDWVIIQ